VHERDAVGDVDEFGEPMAGAVPEGRREAGPVAATALHHHSLGIEHQRQARAGIEDQIIGRRRRCREHACPPPEGKGRRDGGEEDGTDDGCADRQRDRGRQQQAQARRHEERGPAGSQCHAPQKGYIAKADFLRLPEALQPADGGPIDLGNRLSGNVSHFPHAVPLRQQLRPDFRVRRLKERIKPRPPACPNGAGFPF
jgi:hypothetical protein